MEEVKNYYAGRHLISMEEDIVLVCRKSKISMQEGREVEGKSVIRISLLNIDYYYSHDCLLNSRFRRLFFAQH